MDFVHVRVLVAGGPIGQLRRRYRGHAADAAGDDRAQGSALTAHGLEKDRFRNAVEGDFPVGRRSFVAQPRQHLPHGGHGFVHPAGAVGNAALLIHQNQVGMPAHKFADQPVAGKITQFVPVLNADFQNAVAIDLGNAGDPSAHNALAQKHA